jgi:phage-related protein
MRDSRKISWIKAARRDFEEFPKDVQSDMLDALTVAAVGGKSGRQSRSMASMAVSLRLPRDIAAMLFVCFTRSRSTRISG